MGNQKPRSTRIIGVNVEGGTEQEKALAALKFFQSQNGPKQIVCRPLKSNVPKPRNPDWTLTLCSICGKECWKLPQEPDELPEGVTAACTSCALKAGSRA